MSPAAWPTREGQRAREQLHGPTPARAQLFLCQPTLRVWRSGSALSTHLRHAPSSRMLLGMPWRPRAPPVVILRLRILGRVCNLHRTMSVVHRTVLMSYCVCLACPTNARPGGVGTSKTRPIRSETYSSLRVIFVLDSVVADTALSRCCVPRHCRHSTPLSSRDGGVE